MLGSMCQNGMMDVLHDGWDRTGPGMGQCGVVDCLEWDDALVSHGGGGTSLHITSSQGNAITKLYSKDV